MGATHAADANRTLTDEELASHKYQTEYNELKDGIISMFLKDKSHQQPDKALQLLRTCSTTTLLAKCKEALNARHSEMSELHEQATMFRSRLQANILRIKSITHKMDSLRASKADLRSKLSLSEERLQASTEQITKLQQTRKSVMSETDTETWCS